MGGRAVRPGLPYLIAAGLSNDIPTSLSNTLQMARDCATAVDEPLTFYSAAFCCNYINAKAKFIADPLSLRYTPQMRYVAQNLLIDIFFLNESLMRDFFRTCLSDEIKFD